MIIRFCWFNGDGNVVYVVGNVFIGEVDEEEVCGDIGLFDCVWWCVDVWGVVCCVCCDGNLVLVCDGGCVW